LKGGEEKSPYHYYLTIQVQNVLDAFPTFPLRQFDNFVILFSVFGVIHAPLAIETEHLGRTYKIRGIKSDGKLLSARELFMVNSSRKETAMDQKSTLYIGETGKTPIGKLWLAASGLGLVSVEWGLTSAEFETYLSKRFKRAVMYAPEHVREAATQLGEYLTGKRRVFTLVIDWTVLRQFQQSVLHATYAIPYGETRTYKEIAEHVGKPRAARAVGRAEATNPMPLVLPCHRVIGVDGKLHGYGMAEGLKTKEWLLRMEGAVIA
jgi:methylated-DNA-[protein]-cysteine S-methyltransferase